MNKELTGIIFDIQRFSIHDGPGVRTTVFMKGCPLSCKWCHNPEGLSREPQIMYIDEKCICCGKCADSCRSGAHSFANGHAVDFGKCTLCRACAKACPSEALTVCGKEYTLQELYKILVREKIFWSGEGGVTFSGGEPLAQGEFVAEAAGMLRNGGIPVIIDTAGFVKWERFEPFVGLADCFLYDLKHTDGDRHKHYCGFGNALILSNLRRLSESGAEIVIRIPIIGGFNDDDRSIGGIRKFIESLPHKHKINVIPYHLLGKNKYALVGLKSQSNDGYYVAKERIEYIKEVFN